MTSLYHSKNFQMLNCYKESLHQNLPDFVLMKPLKFHPIEYLLFKICWHFLVIDLTFCQAMLQIILWYLDSWQLLWPLLIYQVWCDVLFLTLKLNKFSHCIIQGVPIELLLGTTNFNHHWQLWVNEHQQTHFGHFLRKFGETVYIHRHTLQGVLDLVTSSTTVKCICNLVYWQLNWAPK